MDKKTSTLSGVFIEDHQTTADAVTIWAPSGSFVFDKDAQIFRLNLVDGIINQVNPGDKTFRNIRFDEYAVNLDLQKTGSRKHRHKDEREMTFTELRDFLKNGDRQHKDYFSAQLEFYKKFSIPFACLALGILAVPLGIQVHNARKSSGVGLALICFLVYYLLLSAGEILAEKSTVTPAIGMWMPNMAMAGMAIYLIYITAHDRTIQDELREAFRRLLLKNTRPSR